MKLRIIAEDPILAASATERMFLDGRKLGENFADHVSILALIAIQYHHLTLHPKDLRPLINNHSQQLF